MAGITSTLSMIASFTFITAAAATSCIFISLSYLLIRPFSLTLHRKITLQFSYSFFLISTFSLENWSKMTFKGYGDAIPKEKTVFIILNHSSSVDFLIGLAYLAKLGYPHPGNTKSAVKAALGTVPLFGTMLFFTEFLFLSRSWSADHETFVQKLSSLRDFASTVTPFTFVLFPEGTRLTPDRQKRSKTYTDSLNEPELKHVLYPRFKGFVTTMQTLGDRLDGIIDATLIFENGHPSLKHTISGTSKSIIHAHTKYHPIDSIPKDDEEQLQTWLRDRWYEKEQRISDFKNNPSSLGQSDNKRLFHVEHPSLLPLYVLVAMFILLASVTVYFVSKIPNGIFYLFIFSVSFIILVGIFTMISNLPSKSAKSKTKTR